MEMDSSRGSSSSRSLDRSRQPTAAPVKKPRLAPDDANTIVPTAKARAFPPRPTVPDPRLRSTTSSSTERERDVATAKGGGPASYQQMQELVAQYNTALAELTFNSKPIITNLTIIAGENLLAAKGIAATICANILEVPSEQKLPSLYLLDSIVKNIGRDYIKYFAARLPEVFCKAYKQVDSSIHPGMRHLFGTWKGVFPPATLQFIEKDLGFSSIVNGSSTGGTTARTDSQTQRPPHSIHVNPKYLEARHLLQQSNRTKGVSSKEDNIVDDIERPDRASASGSMRQWTDPSTKNIHRPPRELPKEPSPERSPSLSYGNDKYVSDLSRYSDLKSGRSSKKITEQTGFDVPWYEIGSRSPEVSINQRCKSDSYAQGSYIASRSSQAVDQQLTINKSFANKRNQVSSRNWKNSEEEEYMWDDMNSKLTGHGVNIDSAKGGWDSDDAKKHASLQRDKWTGSQWNKLDPYGQFDKTSAEDRAPYYRDIEEHHLQSPAQHDSGLRTHKEDSSDSLTMGGSWLGHRSSSTRQYQEPQLGTAFGHTSITSRFSSQIEGHQVPLSSGSSTSMGSSFGKFGMRSHEGLPAAVVNSGIGSSSFSHSTPSFASIQNPKAHGLAVHEYQQSQPSPQTNKKLVQILGQLSHIAPSKLTSNSFSTIPSNQIEQSYTLPNLQPALSQSSHHINTSSASSIPYPDMLKYAPLLQQPPDKSPQQVEAQPQPSTETERQSSDLSAPFNSKDPDIESSGQSSASSLLAAIMNSGVISNSPARSLQNFNIQPPLPSGPPPVQVTASSTPLDQFSLATDTMPVVSRVNTPPLATNSARAVQPPLPPGPPPSSTLASSITNTVGINSNPLSSLLKSLVAKGLISSTADEPPSTSAHMPNQLPSQDPSTSAHSASVPDASSTPSSVSQLSLPEYPQVKDVALAQNEAADFKDLIGLEFKPEVIRRLHPVVIDALFDDLKHQCRTCGMRFQLQDQLTKHIAWHDSRKLDSDTSNRTSRKWYINLSDCTAHNMEASSALMDIDLVEPTDASSEKCEPMVPADESQSICALCGEPFEDFYCHVRNEWMYKGTTYMKQPVGKGNPLSLDGSGLSGLIVHAKCIQRRPFDDTKP